MGEGDGVGVGGQPATTVTLPVMNGWTVIRELGENPLTNDIPIVVVTGVEPKPELPHAQVVVCKPCDPDRVADIVSDHLPANAR